MYPAMTLEELDQQQKLINEKRVVCILLVKPGDSDGDAIIRQFNFLHYSSGKYCTIFAPGYSRFFDLDRYPDMKEVRGTNNETWFYSDKAFCQCIIELENRLPSWSYNSESELIVLQSQVDSRSGVSFKNYMAIEIEHGIRQGYIDSFPRFMSALIKAAKCEIDVKGLQKQIARNISIRDLVIETISECKRVPMPVKKILKQKLFITAANRRGADTSGNQRVVSQTLSF